MTRRLKALGITLVVLGIAFLAGAGVAFAKVQDGYDSLQAFSAEQNVELTYNEDGKLTDRGETEGADAIMSLLQDDWKYPVVRSPTSTPRTRWSTPPASTCTRWPPSRSTRCTEPRPSF